MGKIIIDCDVKPFIPEGWEIRPEDQLPGAVDGKLEFDPADIVFHLADDQVRGESMDEIGLIEKLSGLTLLKSNVSDYLLANPNLIPEEWKRDEHGQIRRIYFWGTVFRDPEGCRFIRCLYWHDDKWDSYDHMLLDEEDHDYYWLHSEFNDQNPAAVLAL